MGDLKSFLIDLALNPDLMRAYASNPQGALERAGLTGEERAAMLSGDSARLRVALGRPDNDCMSQISVRVTEAATGRRLRMADLLPLEKTVTLPIAIDMELEDGRVRRYEAGSKITRHRRLPRKRKRASSQKAKRKQ